MSTWLWVAWVAAFAILEGIGLSSGTDSSYTLTNRIRALMRANPALKWAVRGGIGIGLLWLAQHFLLVDPVANPGA